MPNVTEQEKDSTGKSRREPASHVRFFSHSTRLFHHHISTEFVLLGLIEFIVLIVAFYIAHELRYDSIIYENGWSAWFRAVVFAIVMQASLVAFGAYQRQANLSRNALAIRVAASLLLGSLVLGLMYYSFPAFLTGRGVLALAVFVAFVAVMAIRLVFYRISEAYDLRLRVLVLGAGKAADLVKKAESDGDIAGINVVAYMPMPGYQGRDKGIGLARTPGAVVKFVAGKNIDVFVLAMDERRKGLQVHVLIDCKLSGI